MLNILLVNGHETRPPAATGKMNELFSRVFQQVLGEQHDLHTTIVANDYDIASEQKKYQDADIVVLHFPIFWFSTPSSLKKYIDDVYSYGVFFGPSEYYGRGGLMQNTKYMLVTSWNATENDFHSVTTIIQDRSPDDVLDTIHMTQQYVGMEKLPSFVEFDVVQNPDYEGAAERLTQHITAYLLTPALISN